MEQKRKRNLIHTALITVVLLGLGGNPAMAVNIVTYEDMYYYDVVFDSDAGVSAVSWVPLGTPDAGNSASDGILTVDRPALTNFDSIEIIFNEKEFATANQFGLKFNINFDTFSNSTGLEVTGWNFEVIPLSATDSGGTVDDPISGQGSSTGAHPSLPHMHREPSGGWDMDGFIVKKVVKTTGTNGETKGTEISVTGVGNGNLMNPSVEFTIQGSILDEDIWSTQGLILHDYDVLDHKRSFKIVMTPIPEPSTALLMSIGLVAMAASRRHSRARLT